MPHGTRREQCASNDPSSHPNRSTCLLEHPVGLPASTLDATPKDTPKVAIRSILPPTQSIPQTRRPIRHRIRPTRPPTWTGRRNRASTKRKRRRTALPPPSWRRSRHRSGPPRRRQRRKQPTPRLTPKPHALKPHANAQPANTDCPTKTSTSSKAYQPTSSTPKRKHSPNASKLPHPPASPDSPQAAQKKKTKSTTLSGSIAAHYS